MNEKFNYLYAPPENLNRDHDTEVWQWCETNKERGKKMLRTCAAWQVADQCLNIVLGRDKIRRPGQLSVLVVRKLRRMWREMVANQANIRPRWGYKSLNDANQSFSSKMGKLMGFWWFACKIDKVFRGVLQFMLGGGTGYLVLYVDNYFDGIEGNVQIAAQALNHRSVFVIHPSEDNDLQKAYAIGVWYEMSLPETHRKYPWAIDIIRADRNAPSRMTRAINAVVTPFRGVIDRWRRKKGNVISEVDYPTVDVVCFYVTDDSINTSGEVIRMGEGDFAYDVPSLYSLEPTQFEDGNGNYLTEIETGEMIQQYDDTTGQTVEVPKTRRAEIGDCQLYPNRREIIWCSGGIIYDDTAQNFHGRVPIVQFKADDVEGEFLAFPIIADARPLVDSANRLFRSFEDAIHRKHKPDLVVDSAVPPDVVDKLKDQTTFGRIIQYPVAQLVKAVMTLVPHEYHEVRPESFQFAEKLLEWADYIVGTKDSSSWSKLQQLPGADTIESLLQSMGDLGIDISRNVERSLLDLGPIWLGLAIQVYTPKSIMRILGAESAAEFIDFDATSIVPLYNPKDKRPRWKRARDLMANLSFYASPNSVQERASLTNQLKYMQMRKEGLAIDGELIYTTMTGETDYSERKKKFFAEQMEMAKAAANLQKEIQKIMQIDQTGQNNPLAALIQGLQNGSIDLSQFGENGNQVGRPNSYNAEPELEQKFDDNGVPRQSLTTS